MIDLQDIHDSFVMLIIGTIFILYLLKYWFEKYFTADTGMHVDITTSTDSTQQLWGKDLVPTLNGLRLKIVCRLLNSRFGQRWLAPFMRKNTLLMQVRNCICNHKPTFYPIKIILGVEYAKETDKINHSSLKNLFKKELEWRPTAIDDYVLAYKENRTTPLEIANDIIGKIQSVNSELHIFCDVNTDLIISQATESTRRYTEGKTLGPLDGVPIVIKDQINVIGLTVRNGLQYPEYEPCSTDAEVTKRVRAEGMMIIGLANMHPVGLTTMGTNNSKFHGDCLNPLNPEYSPGGSSSGTAAAVAIGIAPCGIGSDGGGSVRLPAAFCGLSAIKPSAGRISNRGFLSGTNSVLGPICNTMVDCAKLYSVLAGPDFENKAEMTFFQPTVKIPLTIASRLDGIKIGVDYSWCEQTLFGQKNNETIYNHFLAKLDWLEEKGCDIVKITFADLDYYHAAHLIIYMQELLVPSRRLLETERHMSLDHYLAMAFQAEGSYGSDYIQANKIRTKFMCQMETIFKEVDLVATPTQKCGTVKLQPDDALYGRADAMNAVSHSHFTRLANLTGIPAISTPMGLDDNNMPVGFHLMAKWWNEEELMKVGVLLESTNQYQKPKRYLPNRFLNLPSDAAKQLSPASQSA